jgi:hypothetical protein
VGDERSSYAEPGHRAVDGEAADEQSGPGSGDCFATAAGALDRSMPVIDMLT